MKRISSIVMIAALAVSVLGATSVRADGKDDKRAEIDARAEKALAELFEQSDDAKALFDKAHAYAVFTNLKIAIGVSGGGGSGVAVDKQGSERTYMKMGTAGIGLGLGGQKYHVVFLFQEEKKFRSFVDKGWQADTSAKAAAGTEGVSAASGFVDGVAIYQLNESGLMAAADIAGTKYWKNKKLNDDE